MNIKNIREEQNLSQSEFAKAYGFPVRTLQDWEQGRRKPPKYLLDLILKSPKQIFLKSHHVKNPEKFKVFSDSFMNAEYIYPIQQRKIRLILDEIEQDINVKKVIVFGSSVTCRCHTGSDVDIYFELSEDRTVLHNFYDFEIDCWTCFSADKHLKEEIYSKGVTVYERKPNGYSRLESESS